MFPEPSASDIGLKISEELTPESIRDEIIWSLYASLEELLDYVILIA